MLSLRNMRPFICHIYNMIFSFCKPENLCLGLRLDSIIMGLVKYKQTV